MIRASGSRTDPPSKRERAKRSHFPPGPTNEPKYGQIVLKRNPIQSSRVAIGFWPTKEITVETGADAAASQNNTSNDRYGGYIDHFVTDRQFLISDSIYYVMT